MAAAGAAEFGAPGWVGYVTTGWTIRMHVQELAENIPDMAHFNYVHGVGTMLRAELEIDGHVYRQRSLCVVDESGGVHQPGGDGLGLVWLRTKTEPETWFLTATTPIDDEHVELRLLFLARDETGAGTLSPAGRAMIDATAANTARDVPIWEHKVYVERAPLVPDDGPIRGCASGPGSSTRTDDVCAAASATKKLHCRSPAAVRRTNAGR